MGGWYGGDAGVPRAAVALDAWVAAVYLDVPLAEKDEAKRLGENKTCVERS